MNARRALLGLVVLLVAVPLSLFYVQNAGTRIDLIFRLPGMSWYLAQATPAPLLLAMSLVGGGLLSSLFLGPRLLAKSRRVRLLSRQVAALEDDLALARLDRTDKSTGSAAESSPAEGLPLADESVEDATDFDELI